MKSFIKSERNIIGQYFIFVFVLTIFFIIFEQELKVLWLAVGLIGVLLTFYLVWQYLNFQKELSYQAEAQSIKEELYRIKHDSRMRQQDIEEYFLMWIHQIKTPIAASQLIIDELEQQDKMALSEELLKIENYTNLALNYLKVTNPSRDLLIKKVNLTEIIHELIRRYRSQFISKNITFHIELPDELFIITDQTLMSLVIEQILSNALKYSKVSGDIWINYDDTAKNLEIRDNGIGIRREDQKRIFEKGYAGYNGEQNAKSTGIGLYLVTLISERLNLSISVDSAVDIGTSFIINLSNL